MAPTLSPLPAVFAGRVAPIRGDAAVLVSGGSDSVALLRLAAHDRLGSWRRLRVLHFDHQLREASSDDADFVRELAERLKLPCDVVKLEPTQVQHGEGGLQASARDVRRMWTMRYLAEHRLSWALMGHTRDDHLETVAGQILRGRGPQDRKGILPVFGAFVRPLLGLTRLALQQWLDTIGQAWRSDASNETDIYQRNYLRHHCMPALEIAGSIPHLESSAHHARHLWQRAHAYLMRHTGASPSTALACRVPEGDELFGLSVCALWAGYRGLRVSRDQWRKIWRSDVPSQMDGHGGRVCRLDNWLWMLRPQDIPALEESVRTWLALDKPTDVPILSYGMGYPEQSRFEYAGRRVTAQEAFRRAAIPAFLRPRIGWKLQSDALELFPAPRDGLTAVHLLP